MLNANIFNPPLPSSGSPSGRSMIWHYPVGGSISLALSAAMQHSTQPMLIVATDNLSVSRLLDELHFFNAGTVLPFPDWETLAYDHFSPHHAD